MSDHQPADCGIHHRDTALLANGELGSFCCACSWAVRDYVWPCAGSQ